jgi:hypothetical protein
MWGVYFQTHPNEVSPAEMCHCQFRGVIAPQGPYMYIPSHHLVTLAHMEITIYDRKRAITKRIGVYELKVGMKNDNTIVLHQENEELSPLMSLTRLGQGQKVIHRTIGILTMGCYIMD